MLCCIRRAKPVEKNEDADLKIEQDANKPEDKAHKAATKIQASFRGHIIRKKLKDEKKEDSPPVQEGATEGEEKKEKASPVTESAAGNEPANDSSAATNEAKSPEKEKPVNSPTAAAAASPTAASRCFRTQERRSQARGGRES
ncbi:hypothetical protein ANANG_G00237540 [Anguilla anguilla]|uniref:Neuromodulin n=1 Tax=Anguilla anguilla TaxID=7936 RepID=A0A9D3LYK5_ANGAN|nr:hypothetical protein ANANG_G00237540 [Anguilla anguilla]